MDRRMTVWVGIVVSLVACASFVAAPVAAHEHLPVDPYEFTVGWREEPPVVGVLNGLDLEVVWLENGTAVLGAHRFLSANLTKGSARMGPPLVPQFGRDGWYTFDVIPTEPGIYAIHVTGNLDGTAVDFTRNLAEVASASTLEFPKANPTPGDLQGQVTTLLVIATVGLGLAVVSTASTVLVARRLRPRT